MYEQIFKHCCYVCIYMNKPEWTKTKGFRLPQRTLEQLDYLIEKGAARNATEAIIISVEHLATEYKVKDKLKISEKAQD